MGKNLSKYPAYIGLNATIVSEPELTGAEWFEAHAKRHANDGNAGRLVSMFTFNTSWNSWEVHPHGHELVLCTSGCMTLIQEVDGKHLRTKLQPGEYAINAPGVWHTADVETSATAVFITAGAGTDHRPR